ncbi:MAG: hypothetical protein GY860_01960 [Desulfobacteraceae bacterium]|nr:hypothetical protein [Desulfobacteraceae bacterium]
MKININEIEITQAIKEYIGNQGIDVSSKKLEVIFKTTRNPASHSATVMILDDNQDPAVKVELENTMTENFALESTGDPVAKEAVQQVDEIVATAAKEPVPEDAPPEVTPEPEKGPDPEPDVKDEADPIPAEEIKFPETAGAAEVKGDALVNF